MLGKLKDARDEEIEKKVSLKNNLESLRNQKQDKEQEHDEKMKALKRFEAERKKLSVARKVRTELEGLYGRYEYEEINKINNKTKEIFDTLIRKQDVFTKVFIIFVVWIILMKI